MMDVNHNFSESSHPPLLPQQEGSSRPCSQILSQYDITLVQEIVDISDTAIHNLTDRVSEYTGLPYQVSLSPRVGRNSYEQYAYVFR